MKTKDVLKKSLLESTDNIFIQLFRYTFVGGAAFAVDFLLLVGLTELCGLHYLVSATISFIAGLLVNYFISKAWVFSQSRVKQKGIEFLIFALIGVVGLALNTLLLKFITETVGLHYTLSKIITAAIVYLYNFLARKYLLFHISR
ncbi:MAG: GtrA family protein [Bacteroidaceae bacterium]|jgi:putative flippase GtrA